MLNIFLYYRYLDTVGLNNAFYADGSPKYRGIRKLLTLTIPEISYQVDDVGDTPKMFLSISGRSVGEEETEPELYLSDTQYCWILCIDTVRCPIWGRLYSYRLNRPKSEPWTVNAKFILERWEPELFDELLATLDSYKPDEENTS